MTATKDFHLLNETVASDNIFRETLFIDTKIATHSNNVPTNIVKANADLLSIFVSNTFNESGIFCKFLSVFKLADVAPEKI